MNQPPKSDNNTRQHLFPFVIPSITLDGGERYPPFFDTCIAGGIGGSTADFIMHSVDTVKTRLQGQPHNRAHKYTSMVQAYKLLWKQEGIMRGLYAGVTPAMIGSIPGTTLYFAIYELTKRTLNDLNVPEVASHLTAGSLGDLAASFIYVPSEVLKTRLQLQGRYNNPHFISGYNYKNTWHATKMIVKYDGFSALFHGFRATILRDVPYSALQFACYEQFKKFAQKNFIQPGGQLPIGIDMITGSLAGGIAGAITTPLDVMKTLLQTQQGDNKKKSTSLSSSSSSSAAAAATTTTTTTAPKLIESPVKHYSGIIDGMLYNYKSQGLSGLFRGIGPRVFWTSLQSSIMFVVYEQVLHIQSNLRDKGEWPPSRVAEKFI
ncbi:mitochondrial carrier domain-containing protein [Cokeromyces recurvatus]|uniref:mitochondrial carrier domain-containing protein n=1 Tax=Cokeromyces recurvatus TaxID=90255 RepID=UPI00221E6F83|nr:mitochondrial carrier domain-containing protein [Cokeromyces recurvatus]KAI7900283.1 mitochondrial carrier domain-containing protein [Cokeromyces recurvatus]